MKKVLFCIVLVSLLVQTNMFAQIKSYGRKDNVKDVAYEVEELDSTEIRSFNIFAEIYKDYSFLMELINSKRAFDNLAEAPSTIVDFDFKSQASEADSIPDALGACRINASLINNTFQTIKEIIFEFVFYNDKGVQVYDIKTGDSNCILKFSNIKGLTPLKKISDIFLNNHFECRHILEMKNASYIKPFYNKTAKRMVLKDIIIKYEDGSISNDYAIFDRGLFGTDNLSQDGPLRPLAKYMNKIIKDMESQK